VSGRLVRTLADRQLEAGEHRLVWDGRSDAGAQVARGVYFTQVRYRSGGFVSHRKLTVLR
jgi:flagellar hook assembly protein FlgD